MIEIILASCLSSIIMMGYGHIFCNFAFGGKYNPKEYIYEVSIFGIVFIGFLAVIINFFFPLNKFIGNFFFLLGIFFFIFFYLKNFYKFKVFKYVLISSIISFALITYSNTYRPDAGLYHLPFISVLNENKIIIGLANIHFRFGTNSIIQYISAIYNNHILNQAFITMPLASIFSCYILFNLKKIFLNLQKENYQASIIVFCVLIFSIYSFSRYSNYGNDAPAHMFYFLIIIYLLNNEHNKSENLFFKISYISVFLFAIKAFMFVVLIFPLLIFMIFKIKQKLILNKNSIIIFIFIFTWLLKSVLTSGCFIYPVSQTCIKNWKIYDHEKTILESKSGEAWAKDWINQNNKSPKLNFDEYNKNFNWINTWTSNHLIKIYEKITPFLIFLLILLIFFIRIYFLRKNNKPYNDNSNSFDILILSLISLFFSIIWFLKFPLYRYGLGFLLITFILTYSFSITPFARFVSKKKISHIFIILIIIGFSAFSIKNMIRILSNINTNYANFPWPRIYSLDENKQNIPKEFTEIKDNRNFLYFYSGGELCMYSKSPCSNYNIEKLKVEKFLSYSIYYID